MDTFPFILKKGANRSFTVTYLKPDKNIFDLTGYSAKLQVRESYESKDALITLSALDEINIDIPLGKIQVNFKPIHTAGIPNIKKNYVYDLEISTDPNNVIRLIEGIITITPEVTV